MFLNKKYWRNLFHFKELFTEYTKFTDNNGIVTAEFILASLIVLIIISSVISVIFERMETASTMDELGNARMICEKVAETINKVYSSGDGHTITLNLPSNISNQKYEIKVNSSGVYIFIEGMVGKSQINPKRITKSNKLIEANVWMHGNRSYIIKNIKSHDGINWIVINEG